MGLTDDFNSDETKTGLPIVYMSVGVISFIILVVFIVLITNSKSKYSEESQDKAKQQMQTGDENGSTIAEAEISGTGITSDQLDFWNMYKKDEVNRDDTPTLSANSYKEKAEALREEEKAEDLSGGGTKTKVTLPDQTEEWVMINAYISKNQYDYIGLVYQEPIMKYYENGSKVSYAGVSVSKESGFVNYKQLKNNGIDYAMIRMGSRGYSTGQINIDDNFTTNMEGAIEQGMNVGVTFLSQAVTTEEAIEETEVLIANLQNYDVKYPVVFQMEEISNDSSRTSTLSKMQLTEIARVFCDKIAEAGYTPMIYGNKYWLLRKLDLTKLSKYEIWLDQSEDVPDYPYKFSMWQYKNDGNIAGITGDAKLSISFVNYTMR